MSNARPAAKHARREQPVAHEHSHGHSHGHSHSGGYGAVPVSRPMRAAVLAFLGIVAVLTVVGLVRFWPDGSPRPADSSADYAAPGVTFPHAAVREVGKACSASQEYRGDTSGTSSAATSRPACDQITVRVTEGQAKGSSATIAVPPDVARAGLQPGDKVQLLRIPGHDGGAAQLEFFSVDRAVPLGLLTLVFVLVVVLVARWRGLLALVGLGIGAVVLVKFMLPALLTGQPGVGVALTGSAAIMFVVLYLAHGPSLRTSTALAGTLVGVLITALLGLVVVHQARLSGVSDETGAILQTFVGKVSFQGLLTCAVIVAGLGVLNDVTITQASAVWELRGAGAGMSRRTLFARAMRIGRDHIASTIYTIVFAYAGTALSVLLLLFVYDRPLLDLLSTEDIAEEVARTLVSAIGLVLAVPVTTAIAVATVSPRLRR